MKIDEYKVLKNYLINIEDESIILEADKNSYRKYIKLTLLKIIHKNSIETNAIVLDKPFQVNDDILLTNYNIIDIWINNNSVFNITCKSKVNSNTIYSIPLSCLSNQTLLELMEVIIDNKCKVVTKIIE